jgi:hypothetical protein
MGQWQEYQEKREAFPQEQSGLSGVASAPASAAWASSPTGRRLLLTRAKVTSPGSSSGPTPTSSLTVRPDEIDVWQRDLRSTDAIGRFTFAGMMFVMVGKEVREVQETEKIDLNNGDYVTSTKNTI